MVAEQKEFGQTTAEYLEANEVGDLFAQLLRQVIIQRPDNPIKFLQEQLRAKPKLCACIMGPPGIKRSNYCEKIASEYNVKHIHVGKLLRAKKELLQSIDAGDLVDDQIVIDLVKAELAKVKGQGWVLDGFPRTKVQAQSLTMKETGTCVDTVLLLCTAEDSIRNSYASKMAPAGDNEDAVNRRLQQYHRHVVSIAEVFKNIVRQIDISAGHDDQKVIYNSIKTHLHVRPFANAPLRMHRICIVGPCGSGRTTQSIAVAQEFGVVHVDVAALILQHQKASGRQLEDVPPEYVGDEELCALVGRRLSENDCVRKGWVLDGFPRTAGQAEFLRQSHQWPTRIIQLDTSETIVNSRIAARRIDPETGLAYYSEPGDAAIKGRLVKAAHDAPEEVKRRCVFFTDNVKAVEASFRKVFSAIKSDGQVADIKTHIKSKIETALQFELAQES